MHSDMIDNKYSKWYFAFIESRKYRRLDCAIYVENHHILPKSLGGLDIKSNMINLTAKEHFFAHLLLSKMFSGSSSYKMSAALNAMQMSSTGKRYVRNSRQYSLIKSIQHQIRLSIADDYNNERVVQGEILNHYTDFNKVLERGVCEKCGIRPKAVNYVKNNKNYYRKTCDQCARAKTKGPHVPNWFIKGYQRKSNCECCGFKAEYKEQLIVIEVEKKFKTVCLNCQVASKMGKKLIFDATTIKEKLSIKADF